MVCMKFQPENSKQELKQKQKQKASCGSRFCVPQALQQLHMNTSL